MGPPLPKTVEPPTVPGKAPVVPMDGQRHPRYHSDALGWNTKNIKEDLREAHAILQEMLTIIARGSVAQDPNSLDPESRAVARNWTTPEYTAENMPQLRRIRDVILSRLRTVPGDVLERAVHEQQEEMLKVPPLPRSWGRGPLDPPERDIKIEAFPGPSGPKPPGRYDPNRQAVPLLPLDPQTSSIAPEIDPSFFLPGWDQDDPGPRPPGSRDGGVVTPGGGSPWGGGPEGTPGAPGQRGVIAVPGGSGQPGGSSLGPGPGQGGTLVSPGQGASPPGQGGGGLPFVPGGASQKGGGTVTGGGAEPVGARGGGGGDPGDGGSLQKGKADGGPKRFTTGDGGGSGSGGSGSSGGGSGSSGGGSGSVPPNPYTSVPDNPYGSSESDDGDSGSGSGGSGERTASGRGGKRASADDSHQPQPPVDITLDDPLPPELDPHGQGGGSSDLPGTRVRQARPRGVTQQDVDLVGPAFRKVTGPDDKERPATGATSGTVSQNPSESRTDDVGGLHRPGLGGGGTAGAAFEILLKDLGLWDKWQAGGPDPAK